MFQQSLLGSLNIAVDQHIDHPDNLSKLGSQNAL
jgi:hypothetical protein